MLLRQQYTVSAESAVNTTPTQLRATIATVLLGCEGVVATMVAPGELPNLTSGRGWADWLFMGVFAFVEAKRIGVLMLIIFITFRKFWRTNFNPNIKIKPHNKLPHPLRTH